MRTIILLLLLVMLQGCATHKHHKYKNKHDNIGRLYQYNARTNTYYFKW